MTNKERAKNKAVKDEVQEGVRELVIREGEAPVIHEQEVVVVAGTVTAPRKWWENRHGVHNHHKESVARVQYSKTAKEIILITNENSHFHKTIKGALQFNQQLNEFNINKNKMYSIKELAQFLKPRRFFFKDRSECTKIISNLEKFSATVTTKIEQQNDRRGNTVDSIVTETKSTLDLQFELKIPIYKGEEPKEFKVNIECDSNGGNLQVYLVSDDLFVMEFDELDAIFKRELEPFEKANVVCIEQ